MVFRGKRLRIARIYRNLTISELAEKVSVSKQAISQYENSIIAPKADVVFEFVSTLGFPLDFFTENGSLDIMRQTSSTFFRSSATTKALDLNTQEIKTTAILCVYNYLKQYLNFPQLYIPEIYEDDFFNMDKISLAVRAEWGLGEKPIENMVALLESKGIVVSALNTYNKKIDAFTQAATQNGIMQFCVVLGNDKQSMVRRNFDAAHELGHIVLHKHLMVRDLSTDEMKAIEQEANSFAASFLLPQNAFYSDLRNPGDLDAYIPLKKKWKVSIAAMIMRARAIGRLSPQQFQSLMEKRSYRKWITTEPFDNEWPLQEPKLFKKAIKILIDNDIKGDRIMLELSKQGLTMPSIDIETLLDLVPNTLQADNPQPFKLKLIKNDPMVKRRE